MGSMPGRRQWPGGETGARSGPPASPEKPVRPRWCKRHTRAHILRNTDFLQAGPSQGHLTRPNPFIWSRSVRFAKHILKGGIQADNSLLDSQIAELAARKKEWSPWNSRDFTTFDISRGSSMLGHVVYRLILSCYRSGNCSW